ncbi:hypothetical protein ACHAWF_008955 [Thalassiosira exigua]
MLLNLVARRLTYSISYWLNAFLKYIALIDWLSKRQTTIEGSVLSAEFVAMKHRIETDCGTTRSVRSKGFRNKIKMRWKIDGLI